MKCYQYDLANYTNMLIKFCITREALGTYLFSLQCGWVESTKTMWVPCQLGANPIQLFTGVFYGFYVICYWTWQAFPA